MVGHGTGPKSTLFCTILYILLPRAGPKNVYYSSECQIVSLVKKYLANNKHISENERWKQTHGPCRQNIQSSEIGMHICLSEKKVNYPSCGFPKLEYLI